MVWRAISSTVVVLLLVAEWAHGQQGNPPNKPYSCYASDPDPYLQFGTKTAYDFSTMRQSGRGQDSQKIPGCRPLQVWMVARHGAKTPSAAEIQRFSEVTSLRDEIIKNSQDPKTSKLCQQDVQNLQNWSPTLTAQDEDKLSDQGKEDMGLLARRIKTRFTEILGRDYSEQAFTFKHVNSERAESSARAFAEAMFQGSQVRLQKADDTDTMLRSYQRCPYWQEQVDDNPDTLRQMENFLTQPELQSLASNVSVRLGFKYNLALDPLLYAYDLCRYEKANNIKVASPWCALFTTEELKLMEYAEDLKYFYNSGYGNSVNQRIGCPLLRDFMYRFRRVASGATEPAAVFYFAHQTTLMTLLARMGIGHDQSAISSSNFQWQQKRAWRTSSLSPFGGNLMAVFLNCSLPRGGYENKVAFYLQETIVPLQGCDVGLCSWNTVMDRYMQLAEDCNLNRTCAGQDGASQIELSLGAIVGAVIVLYVRGG